MTAKDKHHKHPYNDCCIDYCLNSAEWLPVVLIYDPKLGRLSEPNQVVIRANPLCNSHKKMGRIGLFNLISPGAWETIANNFVAAGLNRPHPKFTGIGFVRKDDALIAAEAQFLDPRKIP